MDTGISSLPTFNSGYHCAILASEICVYVFVDPFESKFEGAFTDHTQIR